jgi:hypothetical protein
MFSTRPANRIAELLQWEGDLCELRLDSAAVRYFLGAAYSPSKIDILRGSNLALIGYAQGLTLVTLVHRDLIPQLRLDGSRGDFGPMICSSVSFDGDTMHKLKQDFVRKLEIEFRQMVLLIHFSVLNGIIGALPRGLTRNIRLFRGVAKGVRWGLWVFSGYQLFTIGAWHSSHSSQDPLWSLIQFVLVLLVGCIAPWGARRLLGFYIKSNLQSARKAWHKEVIDKGAK